MCRSRKFFQRVSKFDNVFFLFLFVFLVDKGIEDASTAINGPSFCPPVKRYMAFCWQADDGLTLNACLVAFVFFLGIQLSIAKKPYIL